MAVGGRLEDAALQLFSNSRKKIKFAIDFTEKYAIIWGPKRLSKIAWR